MAKQFTRNYDNMFVGAFGCVNTYSDSPPSPSTPSFDVPMIRHTDGNYYPLSLDGNRSLIVGGGITILPPAFYGLKNFGISSSTKLGDILGMSSSIMLGTGTTPASYEDYHLESPITSNMTMGVVSSSWEYEPDTHIYTKTYKIPVAYSGTNDVTISEFGIYCPCTSYWPSRLDTTLIYRETLDYPITLSQNDTIEITFSQSIMQPNYTPYPTE